MTEIVGSVASPSRDLKGLVDVVLKYAEGRSKRVRNEGLQQYIDPSGSEKFKHFVKDTWIDNGTSINEPVADGGLQSS